MSIWTPPMWDIPIVMMAMKKGPGGHMIHNPSGHIVKSCGEPSPAPCTDCPGLASVVVTTSSMVRCPCTIDSGFFGGYRHIANDSLINRAYSLDPVTTTTSNCQWLKDFSSIVLRYNDPSCTTPMAPNSTVRVVADFVNATKVLTVQMIVSADLHTIFLGSITAPTTDICSLGGTSAPITNTITSCDGINLAHSGSATVSFVYA